MWNFSCASKKEISSWASRWNMELFWTWSPTVVIALWYSCPESYSQADTTSSSVSFASYNRLVCRKHYNFCWIFNLVLLQDQRKRKIIPIIMEDITLPLSLKYIHGIKYYKRSPFVNVFDMLEVSLKNVKAERKWFSCLNNDNCVGKLIKSTLFRWWLFKDISHIDIAHNNSFCNCLLHNPSLVLCNIDVKSWNIFLAATNPTNDNSRLVIVALSASYGTN